MNSPYYLQIALDTPLRRVFDYLPPEEDDDSNICPKHVEPEENSKQSTLTDSQTVDEHNNKTYSQYQNLVLKNGNHSSTKSIAIGARVLIPFGKREETGIIISQSLHSTYERKKIKRIIACLDEIPLFSKQMLELIHFTSQYYHHPLGEVFALALPHLLWEGKNLLPSKPQQHEPIHSLEFHLNLEQQQAYQKITESLHHFQVFLLQGITGSGKTEVYLSVIQKVIEQEGQILVLVPEIGLTPQTLTRFEKLFTSRVATYHSGLTEKNKHEIYSRAFHGDISIIIGTRSALFLPLANLKLIVVDEEHDPSYKQQEGCRYHARDLAIKLASIYHIPIILGSATPSLESFLKSKEQLYQRLILKNRAVAKNKADFTIIDIREKYLEQGLSEDLVKKMQHHLQKGHQVLLFQNRRGFAPVMMCFNCQFKISCQSCSVSLVYHHSQHKLTCHHCGKEYSLPQYCPNCQQMSLSAIGFGTERLELILQNYFPDFEIVRIDRDTTKKKNSLQEKIAQIQQGQAQILIGTQMMAKGHDFPNLTLVGIIDVDSGFLSADFRASERTGQLILQVAGRAGRHKDNGEVVIQTRMPELPLLQSLIHQDYDAFIDLIAAQRKAAYLPPFYAGALIRAESVQYYLSESLLKKFKLFLSQIKDDSLMILGPSPALIEKKQNRYRLQILLLSPTRKTLHHVVHQLIQFSETQKISSKIRWNIEIDPQGI